MQDSSMTDIIYDYFTSRILFGYFLPGDQLPSVGYTCRQFQVSALTVRAAFARMREEGYIETTQRKSSTVTFRPNERQEQWYRESFFSRKEGMDDICRHSDILFGPIAPHYLHKQNEASIQQIRSQLKKRKGYPAKQIIMFYGETMRELNNPLALNLYWEIVRYLRMPYLPQDADFDDTGAQAQEHMERMLELIEKGHTEKAVTVMQAFNRDVILIFFQKMSAMMAEKRPMEHVPFKWQIYREHPQLCYTLSAQMMADIDAGLYKQGEFLPSCQTLAQRYDVSLITMRRTLGLLNDIRVTETLNGIGTRVISDRHAGIPKLSLPVRKSLLLFLQALQINTLTCKNVAVHTLSSLDAADFQALACEIQRNVEEHTVFQLGEVCLRFIGKNSPSPFIREVYFQLYRISLWGHALHMFSKRLDACQIYEDYARRMRAALCSRETALFAALLSELMQLFLEGTKTLLLELGFTEDQML